MPKTENILKI